MVGVFRGQPVQEPEVALIKVALVRLKVVAFVEDLRDVGRLLLVGEELIVGERRRLARAEIGEDQPGSFRYRVRARLDARGEAARRWLGRLLKALTVHRELPAVINAPQTVRLAQAIAEIGAAVRTIPVEQAGDPAELRNSTKGSPRMASWTGA